MNICIGSVALIPFHKVPKGLSFIEMISNLLHPSIIAALLYFLFLICLGVKYANFLEKNFSDNDCKKIVVTEFFVLILIAAFLSLFSFIKLGLQQGAVLTGIFTTYYVIFFTALGYIIAKIKKLRKSFVTSKN